MHHKPSPTVDRPLHVPFDDVLEHLRDCAIFMLDADRRVASWNAGAEHLLGYTADEIVGQFVDLLFTQDDCARGAPRDEAETAARGGCAEDDRWHVRKDGSQFFGSGILTAVRDGAGDVIGFVKILRDVTERRQAAQALAERERLLREAMGDPARLDRTSGNGHARPPAGQFAGVTIVAIDDDADARELMETTLKAYGATVIVAASVPEGLDAVRRHQPDLILTDLAMPGEDGFAFIRKLRHLEPAHLREIPAVVLTAYVRREDRTRLLDAGYQAHLAKPFGLDELMATASALLGARNTSRV